MATTEDNISAVWLMIETDKRVINQQIQISSDIDSDKGIVYEPCTSEECSDDEAKVTTLPQMTEYSQRAKKQTSFYRYNNAVLLNEDELRTYQEAMRHENASEWKETVRSPRRRLGNVTAPGAKRAGGRADSANRSAIRMPGHVPSNNS
ncbi:hypothetical protein EVAR_66101_1 [Eumeta japonica]|uniref:Uncharacterized protein n=1 Tax=Eumeta variegata TaxID=151549 RepID=A0A4C1ZRH2_EUMVA|nr:hypothetical protein EVAR_66101_1 [Eumeta japonica]